MSNISHEKRERGEEGKKGVGLVTIFLFKCFLPAGRIDVS